MDLAKAVVNDVVIGNLEITRSDMPITKTPSKNPRMVPARRLIKEKKGIIFKRLNIFSTNMKSKPINRLARTKSKINVIILTMFSFPPLKLNNQ